MAPTARFVQSPEVLARVERRLAQSGVYDEHFRMRARSSWGRSAGAAVLAFLVVLGLVELYDAYAGDASSVAVGGMIGAVVLLWMRARSQRLSDWRASYTAHLRTLERSAEWLLNEGPTEVSLDAEGISYRGPRLEVSFRWEAVSAVRCAGRDVVIWTVSNWRLVVAGEAFGSQDEAERFAREIIERMASAADRSIIAAFLADHDLACAKCGYPLRGVRRPVCPECGREIGFEDLQRASNRLVAQGPDSGEQPTAHVEPNLGAPSIRFD